MARRCLELFLARHHASTNGSKEEQRKMFRGTTPQGPGIRALSWLIEPEHYDQADLSANTGFLNCLIHALVAEGAEEYVWHWLSIPHPPSVLSSHGKVEQNVWRGVVLRFLVEAQAYWADDINASLRSFERSLNISKRETPLFINRTQAGTWLSKQLIHKGANSTADPQLFIKFVGPLKTWKIDPIAVEFAHAALMKVHPESPSGIPALKFLRRYHDMQPRPVFIQGMFETPVGYRFLMRTARSLQRQGLKTEARWVLDLGLKEMPEFISLTRRRYEVKAKDGHDFGLDSRKARYPDKQNPDADERWRKRRAYLRGDKRDDPSKW